MKKTLLEIYMDVQFHFGGWKTLLAVFLNPFFFIRKKIFTNINDMAPLLSGKILDFGCGAKPYRSCFVNCEDYIGCDIQVSGHSHKNENIDVFYDGKRIPFVDNYFDGIFSSEVFEHIFNLEEILQELNRVIKPGGFMLVTLPFLWNEHEQPYDFARYTSFGIVHILEQNGFQIVEFRKSTLYFEAIWQMWLEFLRGSWGKYTSNIYFSLLFQIIVIAPFTIFGIILSSIMPKNDTLYNDIVVLCRKVM